MYFIVLFLVVVVIGYSLQALSESWNLEIWGEVILVMGLLLLFFSLLMIPLHRAIINGGIAECEAIRQTIVVSREQGELTNLERIRLTEDIVKANRWLASTEYYAGNPWFSIYYPKDLQLPEPIY